MKKGRQGLILVGVIIWLLAGLFGGRKLCAETASRFSLPGIDGRQYSLAEMKSCPMLTLYFFNPESSPCRKGLSWLADFLAKYKSENNDVRIWAITTSSPEQVRAMGPGALPGFPVLLDKKGTVSAAYNATVILPTVLLIGPDLQILDRIQGGGKGLEKMVVRIAERELQRNNVKLAESLGEEAAKKYPQNLQARLLTGYAALKQGKTDKARKTFASVAKVSAQGRILGTEGLAEVYAYKGENDKALKLADKVLREAPERAYPHVIKGNILYAGGKHQAARKEYESGVKKPRAEPYQQGVRFNQLGRLYAANGHYREARKLYDQAVEIDPYYVEGMANKGVTYEKEGKWDKALSLYQKALAVDGKDSISALLARNAQKMLALRKDAERSRRIDRLVKDLVARYHKQKTLPVPEDQWTSRPMIITFLDFEEKGGLAERDGLPIFFASKLADELNASGRVQVVDRIILDKVLQELNLGASELADPETALKLGKIFAAKLISTGSFYYAPGQTLLSLRVIDTETTSVAMVVNKEIPAGTPLDRALLEINRRILKNVIQKYPLRGYVVRAMAGKKLLLNIGTRQGVVPGTEFEVISEGAEIVYKGRKLRGAPEVVGRIKVSAVEPDLSYAAVIEARRAPRRDDKIREIAADGNRPD